MPNSNKSVIDQPLLLAPVANLNKQQQHHQDDLQSQMYMDSKVAQQQQQQQKILQHQDKTNSMSSCGSSSMQQMQNKFTNFNLSQQQMQFKKELDAKLSGPNEQNGYASHKEVDDDNLKQNINLK
jgi:ABC-type Fe3+-citrate transport system substrate-binding protein